MENEIEKEDLVFLLPYKKTYKKLKDTGEIALKDIYELLKYIENSEDDKDPLYPLEILNYVSNIIQFRYLGINIYVRTKYIFEKETGYIEWGIYEDKDTIEFKEIHIDEYDKLGNINKRFSVEHTHILIPEALKKILETIKNDDIYF